MSTVPQTEVKDPPGSLGVIFGQYVESLNIVDFIDWDYCYKSVATKIPHGAGLTLIPYTG